MTTLTRFIRPMTFKVIGYRDNSNRSYSMTAKLGQRGFLAQTNKVRNKSHAVFAYGLVADNDSLGDSVSNGRVGEIELIIDTSRIL